MITYCLVFIFYLSDNCLNLLALQLKIMIDTFHIRIKKDYAAAVIADLQKMDAVEFIDENDLTVPDWHIQLVKDELKKITDNPALLVDWDTAKKQFKL